MSDLATISSVTPLENCARALCAEAMSRQIALVEDKQRLVDELWPSYVGMARVVVEALKHPNEEVCEAGWLVCTDSISDAFDAMIDVVLSDIPE